MQLPWQTLTYVAARLTAPTTSPVHCGAALAKHEELVRGSDPSQAFTVPFETEFDTLS